MQNMYWDCSKSPVFADIHRVSSKEGEVELKTTWVARTSKDPKCKRGVPVELPPNPGSKYNVV